MTDALGLLGAIRERTGESWTQGIPDDSILRFSEIDPSLCIAIEEASVNFESLLSDFGETIFSMDEKSMINEVQSDFVNFYSPETVNPYVALAAKGPWIITTHGAVVHDNGGYGMLGMGHGPEDIIMAMQNNWVMANVMTPSLSQKRLANKLRSEVGHTRGECPFDKFICLNSGTESVAISMRISDE